MLVKRMPVDGQCRRFGRMRKRDSFGQHKGQACAMVLKHRQGGVGLVTFGMGRIETVMQLQKVPEAEALCCTLLVLKVMLHQIRDFIYLFHISIWKNTTEKKDKTQEKCKN